MCFGMFVAVFSQTAIKSTKGLLFFGITFYKYFVLIIIIVRDIKIKKVRYSGVISGTI